MAVFPPSAVFAVIVAVPFLTAFTRPVLLTVAIVVLLLDQVTFLFVALEGCGHAASWKVLPALMVFAVELIFTPVTGTFAVILQVAV